MRGFERTWQWVQTSNV